MKGKHINTSIILIITKSIYSPKYPASIPIILPIIICNIVLLIPTSKETPVPYNSLDNTSLPKSSVPKKCILSGLVFILNKSISE